MKHRSLSSAYFICQDGNGNTFDFPSQAGEVACLAYDLEKQQIVVLHILISSEGWGDAIFRSFEERVVLAGGLSAGSFPRILDYGRLDGLGHFASQVENGESLMTYLQRHGALPTTTSLTLAMNLLEELLELQGVPRLFRGASLGHLLIVKRPEGLRLQVRDLGLADFERRGWEDASEDRICRQLGRLFWQLVAGEFANGAGRPAVERLPLFRQVPALAEFTINVLNGDKRALTLAGVRSVLEKAASAASEFPPPQPPADPKPLYQRAILGTDDPQEVFPAQFRLFDSEHPIPGPFSHAALDAATGRQVLLHPLPSRRVAPRPPFQPVSEHLRNVRQSAGPHLLFPHSTWAGEQFDFIVETAPPSLSLRQLADAKAPLAPAVIAHVLGQIHQGLTEAKALHLSLHGLHPEEIRVAFKDAPSALLFAERMRQPASVWPELEVRLRVHATPHALIEPWLTVSDAIHPSKSLTNEAFLLIAQQLAGGGESAGSHLGGWLARKVAAVRKGEPPPDPEEILSEVAKESEKPAAPAAPAPKAGIPVPPIVAPVALAPPPVSESRPEEVMASSAMKTARIPEPPNAAAAAAVDPPALARTAPAPPHPATVAAAASEGLVNPPDQQTELPQPPDQIIPVGKPQSTADEVLNSLFSEISGGPERMDKADSTAPHETIPDRAPEPKTVEPALPPSSSEPSIVAAPEAGKAASVPPVNLPPFPIEALDPMKEVPPLPVPQPCSDATETPGIPAELDPNLHPAPLAETDDSDVPTLQVDLSRLTTSDSLFARTTRTITIRNK